MRSIVFFCLDGDCVVGDGDLQLIDGTFHPLAGYVCSIFM
jgi:hypothetical protein